jgi:hypothetical protein
MHDEDEKRFPCITLGQFLGGLFGAYRQVDRWPRPQDIADALDAPKADEQSQGTPSAQDDQANRDEPTQPATQRRIRPSNLDIARMPFVFRLAIAALAFTTPAHAQSALESGFNSAMGACEKWVLNPASWVDGPTSFHRAVGLGGRMEQVEHVDERALPPPQLRRANHYWRINATSGAGYTLVVSDRLPCAISQAVATQICSRPLRPSLAQALLPRDGSGSSR